jgi:hypothetical protein
MPAGGLRGGKIGDVTKQSTDRRAKNMNDPERRRRKHGRLRRNAG